MNKKVLIKIFLILIFAFFIISFNSKVKATSISVTPSSPKVGDTVKIKVIVPNVNTAKVIANVSGVVSGKITVVGGNLTESPSTYSAEESFYCEKEGDIKISVSKEESSAVLNGEYVEVGASTSVKILPKVQEDNNTNVTNNDSNSSGNNNDTTATKASTKSNNANLKNLGIKPNDFKGFKSGTTSYSVTVPNDVDKVTVYAEKSDEKATVTGVGSKNLEVGKNALEVTVTAEDGTKKTYTINVTREEKKAEENTTKDQKTNETEENKVPDTTITTTKNSDLVKMEVAGFLLSPKFSPDVYEYKLKVNQDVNELQINTEGKDKDVSIEVVGNKELKDGENTVTVLVTNKNDNKTSTYQIIVEKVAEEENKNYAMQKGLKIRKILIGLMVAFVVFCIVVFIILKRKSSIDTSAIREYEYDEEDSDRINLDEEEEFFNRVNRTKLKRKEITQEKQIEEKENISTQEFEAPKSLRKNREQIEEIDEDDGEEMQYFRSSRPSKKGKHF